MKVVVTGGSGFLGRHLIEALLGKRHQVISLQRQAAHVQHMRLQTLACDLSFNGVASVPMDGVDAIIHLAFDMHGSLQAMRQFALDSTEQLIRACARQGARFILASSFSVYDWAQVGQQLDAQSPLLDDSIDPCLYGHYAQVKRQQEKLARQLCRELRVPLTVVRPSRVWSKLQPPLDIIGPRLAGMQLVIRPERRLHVIHVHECVRYFCASLHDTDKEVTVIATDPQALTAMSMARMLNKQAVCIPVAGWMLAPLTWLSPVSELLLRAGVPVPGLLIRSRLQARFPTTLVHPSSTRFTTPV